jgi:hypothetical protein
MDVFVIYKKSKRLDYLTAAALPIANKVSTTWTSLIRYSFSVKLVKGKVKYHSRTRHEGTEGEYMYSSTLSLTSPLEGWRVNVRPRPFYLENDPVPRAQEAS